MAKAGKLSDKQELFCKEYLVDLNATQAAIRAGYSEKASRAISCENLTKPNIQERIQELSKKRAEKLEISMDRVALEYHRIAMFDPRRLFNEEGSLKPIHELDDDTAAGISSLDHELIYSNKENIGEIKKIRLWDKTKALEALGRHVGFFEKDNEQGKSAPVVINLGTGIKPDEITH